jgi:hypothetical protein
VAEGSTTSSGGDNNNNSVVACHHFNQNDPQCSEHQKQSGYCRSRSLNRFEVKTDEKLRNVKATISLPLL